MTMQTLWQKTERVRTKFGFYFDENLVKFKYSGPFDEDTAEWLDAHGTFSRSEFAEGLKRLERESHSEVKGTAGATLRMKTLPSGTIVLDFDGGPSNNILNLDLGIGPRDLLLTFPQ